MDSLLRTLQIMGLAALLMPLWTHSGQTPNGVVRRDTLRQSLCSTVNTATMASNYSQWQSLGLCSDYCIQKDTAFAIVQYQLCWCSDVQPAAASVESLDNCSQDCPGYDEESCGRQPSNYGYFSLLKPPTSTQGSNSETSTRDATPTTATRTPTPSAAQTVTADGTVRTVFVTPSTSPDTSGSNTETTHNSAEMGSSSGSSGPSTGTVVGIVVGVIAGVVAIAALVLWLFFRRRKQRAQAEDDEPSQRGSSAGMMGTPRNPEMTVTMDGRAWEPETTSEQRRSRLMAMDPRMNPLQRPIYARNKSHESVNTIHDDQDYSRRVAKPVLRATNPDPDD
ncbi:Cell wall integrity and stress response component 4 like protein [Verticillium longisporum]|uniref:Cell wall integrity and stress response component 4 like protein n=2 Tax=Verticillium longisporum TaxID=100787 RepID=A0A0G4KT49_VERLO|nr:2,2-dialkylglycine decarboxylase [Verticillium dahliae VDG1]KAG7118172.1 Cell wall integrity and stress response component 4 like protein [Verticillium longisporum]RBQ88983.1 hypothetical protein VDGD_00616 [Verticillium dahliae]CRK12897.1 hypothetical protein BN1708_010651 [Verticillium longisporum]